MLEAHFGSPSAEHWKVALWQTWGSKIVKNTESEIANAAFSDSGVEFKDDMLVEEVDRYVLSIFIAFHFINR
jgi:hypothetical protein